MAHGLMLRRTLVGAARGPAAYPIPVKPDRRSVADGTARMADAETPYQDGGPEGEEGKGRGQAEAGVEVVEEGARDRRQCDRQKPRGHGEQCSSDGQRL